MVTICHVEPPFAPLVGRTVYLAVVKSHGCDFEVVFAREAQLPTTLGSYVTYDDALNAAKVAVKELGLDVIYVIGASGPPQESVL